jgi:hypothetical protein
MNHIGTQEIHDILYDLQQPATAREIASALRRKGYKVLKSDVNKLLYKSKLFDQAGKTNKGAPLWEIVKSSLNESKITQSTQQNNIAYLLTGFEPLKSLEGWEIIDIEGDIIDFFIIVTLAAAKTSSNKIILVGAPHEKIHTFAELFVEEYPGRKMIVDDGEETSVYQ